MKTITNYRECDAGAWLKFHADVEHEPDVETIATPIPSPIRLPVTGYTQVPQLVSRQSLVSVGWEAAEVGNSGVRGNETPVKANDGRQGESAEVVK